MGNSLPPEYGPCAERVFIVTLALQDAFKQGRWEEVNQLIQDRAEALTDLSASAEASDPSVLEKCADVGNELLGEIFQHRQAIGHDLRKLALWKKAHNLYKTAG